MALVGGPAAAAGVGRVPRKAALSERNVPRVAPARGLDAPAAAIDEDEIWEDEGLTLLFDALEPVSLRPGALVPPRIKRAGQFDLSGIRGACHLFALACAPAVAPLHLGWRWNDDYAERAAPVFARWHELAGFEPVVLGQRTPRAFAPRAITDLAELRWVVEQQIAMCHDFGQGDFPVVAATMNALSTTWDFWWD